MLDPSSTKPQGLGSMRVGNVVIFIGAAFPFLIPVIPSTDTQPTFTLFTLLFTVGAAVQSFSRQKLIPRSDLVLAGAVAGSGIFWFCLSFAANGFTGSNVNRVASFAMFLIALSAGLLNREIFTPRRIASALKTYIFFTAVFFLTHGAIESLIIRSRTSDMIFQVASSGRGASTLSPEPSFFAFQIFSLFLAARLAIWDTLSKRERHIVQLMTIGLLVISFAGYGIIYASLVIFLSGRRYIFGFGLAGLLGGALLAAYYNVESLRFVQILLSIASSFAETGLELKDVSILVRLTSLQEYLQVFNANVVFGDAFAHYGGGGLVSLLAALGLYGLGLLVLAVFAIFFSKNSLRLKLVLLAWLLLQFISGPIGLPLVGIVIGLVLNRSRLGALVSAIGIVAHSRSAERSHLAPSA